MICNMDHIGNFCLHELYQCVSSIYIPPLNIYILAVNTLLSLKNSFIMYSVPIYLLVNTHQYNISQKTAGTGSSIRPNN